MEESEFIKNIIPILKEKGYKAISIRPILPDLKWSFDLFAESPDSVLALEYRKNDKIPDIFLEKIQNIKGYKKRLFIYLTFDKTPRESTILLLNKYGVGVMVFQNDKLYSLSNSKDFSKIHIQKKKPKNVSKEKSMHQIWVYTCSKQYENDNITPCKERSIICKIVNRFKKKKVPIDCLLVEDDMEDDKKFKKKMLRNIKQCHVFVGAINGKYSPYIDYEIKNIFKIKKDKRLILILKKNMKIDEKKQNQLIQYIQTETNHIPYNNFREFEEKVEINLWKMADRLYKLNKSKPPYSF